MPDRIIGIPDDHRVLDDLILPFSRNVPSLWGHRFMRIRELHALGIDGSGVAIAVNDTGYRRHSLLPEPVAQRDFTGSRNGTRDVQGHGNHCAGIALGRAGDDGRSLGVAPGATYICGKVLGDDGRGDTRGINAGREWAADVAAELKMPLVVSESLGDNGGPPIQSDLASFDRAYEKGANICVAALGNAGKRGSRDTTGRPGSYDRTCGVAALQQDGTRADYSSVGDSADLAAPGSNIISCGIRSDADLVAMFGTSMACPFIAGIFALVIQYRQQVGLPALYGYQQWRAFWQDPRFVKDAGQTGRDREYGSGIPQVANVVDWMIDSLAA